LNFADFVVLTYWAGIFAALYFCVHCLGLWGLLLWPPVLFFFIWSGERYVMRWLSRVAIKLPVGGANDRDAKAIRATNANNTIFP